MEYPDVVAHDRCLQGNGCTHGHSVQSADRQGKGHSVPWAGGEKAHLLQVKEHQPGRRTGFHILQRRIYRRECPCQGQGRKRDEARGKVPQDGNLPGLRRFQAFGCGKGAFGTGHFIGGSLQDASFRTRSLGGRHSGIPAGRDAADGPEHLRIIP